MTLWMSEPAVYRRYSRWSDTLPSADVVTLLRWSADAYATKCLTNYLRRPNTLTSCS